jgi:hypothetical protein
MFHRAVALLLMPAVLLMNLASAGQCHGCHLADSHHRHPHIHVIAFSFTWSTPDADRHGEHDCCADLYHGDEPCDEQDYRHDDESPDPDRLALVKISPALLHGWLTGRLFTGSDQMQVSLLADPGDGLVLGNQHFPVPHFSLPIMHWPDCPLYLRALTILI